MLKPIYAFADSQLLFWKRQDGSLFLREVVESLETKRPSIAYIGASNLDSLEVYDLIFKPAMEQVNVGECRMILRRPDPEAGKFLENADILLLAGGDVEVGWRTFEGNGLKELIPRRFFDGALLIGISAGAVQLGRGGLSSDGSALLSTFGLLPFYVAAHEEGDQWSSLRKAASSAGRQSRGIGIPAGAGIKYWSGEVEVLCRPVIEIVSDTDGIRETTIIPLDSGRT